MSKGTLYENLHHPKGDPKFMEWPLRLRIAVGSARGLAWLHHCCHPCIILQNLSSKRIVLDDDYEPKISDFGFAKYMNPTESDVSSSMERFCNSDLIAPELLHRLVPTTKTDVYGFGVLMLELITDKEPTQVTDAPENFYGKGVDWIGHLSNYYAIDESQSGRMLHCEILEFLKIAFSCLAVVPNERPTMMEVFHILRAIHSDDNFTYEDETLMPIVHVNLGLPSEPALQYHAENSHEVSNGEDITVTTE